MRNPVAHCVLCGILIFISVINTGGTNFCSWTIKSITCSNKEFSCLDGQQCTSSSSYCNGVADCNDGSDELYCTTNSCPESFMKCQSKNKCIPNDWKCNGVYDCPSTDDEYNCRYGSSRPRSEIPPENHFTLMEVKEWIPTQKKYPNSAEKWGSSVDRLAMIHYLTSDNVNLLKDEMSYELNIQLLSQLSRMKLGDVPSTDLASYVNAFLVMCINPRNFHGYDIIQELKNRADQTNYTNPYIFVALCNAGETITESYKKKLIDTFYDKHRTFWTDMQAVVVMALACASKQPGNEVDSEVINEMTLKLKQHQYRNGTVENLQTTALVMQALISTDSEIDSENFDEKKAYQELVRNQKSDGSFGDITSTFLVAPVLTCKSLVNVNSSHCPHESRDEVSALQNLIRRTGPKIRVQYSIWIGNEKDMERNLVLRVPQNTSLYTVMETAAEIDSRFKFEYTVKDRKPYINAVSGTRDNPLTGKFWFLYAVQDEQPTLSNKSPADIVPKDNEHYAMWYRRGTWVD